MSKKKETGTYKIYPLSVENNNIKCHASEVRKVSADGIVDSIFPINCSQMI